MEINWDIVRLRLSRGFPHCLKSDKMIYDSYTKELPRVDRVRNPVGDDKIKTLVI